jgi:hypothetical protein
MSTLATKRFIVDNYDNIVKKEVAIANNIFVRKVKQYENYEEYKKFNKTRFDTYEEEKNFIKGKVEYDMSKCACNDCTDIRGRCNPMELRFKICPMRVDTAIWFIENEYNKVEDFYYFTEAEKEIMENEIKNIMCECCNRDGNYSDIVGCCSKCSIENMCNRCGYFNEHESEWYCEPCRDKAVEDGEWCEECNTDSE